MNYETVINLISATRTKPGLKIVAKLDRKSYQKGIKISDEQVASLKIRGYRQRPQWNYTVSPRTRSRSS